MLEIVDYHIHAAFYRLAAPAADPGPTVRDQLEAAQLAGTTSIGIVEHCNFAPHHPFSKLEELAAEYRTIAPGKDFLYRGVEADLLEKGADSCGFEGREKLQLDYVIGSSHLNPKLIPDLNKYIDEEYERICGALKDNANIDFIGHPFTQGRRYLKAELTDRWDFGMIPEKYLDDVVALAAESGKALEVNYPIIEDPYYIKFLLKLRDSRALITVGSDAHDTAGCIRAAQQTALLDKLGFTADKFWKPTRYGTK